MCTASTHKRRMFGAAKELLHSCNDENDIWPTKVWRGFTFNGHWIDCIYHSYVERIHLYDKVPRNISEKYGIECCRARRRVPPHWKWKFHNFRCWIFPDDRRCSSSLLVVFVEFWSSKRVAPKRRWRRTKIATTTKNPRINSRGKAKLFLNVFR